MDHAQHDSVDTQHLSSHDSIDLQPSPSIQNSKPISDSTSSDHQQPRDGDHPLNSTKTNSPIRPSKRKFIEPDDHHHHFNHLNPHHHLNQLNHHYKHHHLNQLNHHSLSLNSSHPSSSISNMATTISSNNNSQTNPTTPTNMIPTTPTISTTTTTTTTTKTTDTSPQSNSVKTSSTLDNPTSLNSTMTTTNSSIAAVISSAPFTTVLDIPTSTFDITTTTTTTTTPTNILNVNNVTPTPLTIGSDACQVARMAQSDLPIRTTINNVKPCLISRSVVNHHSLQAFSASPNGSHFNSSHSNSSSSSINSINPIGINLPTPTPISCLPSSSSLHNCLSFSCSKSSTHPYRHRFNNILRSRIKSSPISPSSPFAAPLVHHQSPSYSETPTKKLKNSLDFQHSQSNLSTSSIMPRIPRLSCSFSTSSSPISTPNSYHNHESLSLKSFNRANSLPPVSPIKRRKDDDVAAKSSTKAGLRATGLGPKISRGIRTRSDLRKTLTHNPIQIHQPATLPIPSSPFLSSNLLPSSQSSSLTSISSQPTCNLNTPTTYRTRSADEFTLPNPAPIYVQLIARHALDLPRVNPIGSGIINLPPSKLGAYGRSSKRNLPNCDSLSSARLATTPEIHLPSWTPPITRSSMAELEFIEVLKNAQLRHDIVFDDVLRFRPNLDGDRGERKRLIADRYWLAIGQELEKNCRCTAFLHRSPDRYHHDSSSFELRKILPCVCSGGLTYEGKIKKIGTIPLNKIPSRIPGLVEELRNILLSLVAPRSPALCQNNNISSTTSSTSAHELINSTFDPNQICQQLECRTLDLPDLANFLGLVLKGHCAPMRDSIVEGMISLISGTKDQFVLEPDAPNAAHDSLQKCSYSGLAGGLRMSFELLELMKLDIANHQLRTLRPILLETALEFEIRYFREQLAKRPNIDRTRRWFQDSLNRVLGSNHQPKIGDLSIEKVEQIVKDGLLELVFNAGLSLNQNSWLVSSILSVKPSSSSNNLSTQTSSPIGSSRFSRQIWSPAPSPNQIPETLLMDTIRLQNLHSDMTDLTIAYMLIMLFKQLVGHSNLRQGDVETIKAEIWVFMSESVMKMKHPERKALPGIGLKKIQVHTWRAALGDILLHLAARIETIRQREKSGQERNLTPSNELISKMMSWMNSHLRTSSALFQLAQKRLRQTFELVLSYDLIELRQALNPEPISQETNDSDRRLHGIPTLLRTGRATLLDCDDLPLSISSSINSGNRHRKTAQVAAAMVAKLPRATKQRKQANNQIEIDTKSVENYHEIHPLQIDNHVNLLKQTGLKVTEAMNKNGLIELEAEIKIVGHRMSKLLNYHLKGYGGLYAHLP
ncbi:hypothetical protein O181_043999 [Austropuccinia psidii MF-1]|uniref:Uncharacterized protein n=1 Tax=Austropuccinia psidii MF-1 TaxID=1389203 RepID=A0A9Q3DJG0_9BASI|nr:hypothetical protein [Austropuccinia psidii MF-1]